VPPAWNAHPPARNLDRDQLDAGPPTEAAALAKSIRGRSSGPRGTPRAAEIFPSGESRRAYSMVAAGGGIVSSSAIQQVTKPEGTAQAAVAVVLMEAEGPSRPAAFQSRFILAELRAPGHPASVAHRRPTSSLSTIRAMVRSDFQPLQILPRPIRRVPSPRASSISVRMQAGLETPRGTVGSNRVPCEAQPPPRSGNDRGSGTRPR